MKVYAPTSKSLVLYTGESPNDTPLRDMFSRMLGAIALLGFVSILINRLVRMVTPSTSDPISQNLDGVFNGASNTSGGVGIALSPGLVFFVGGLFILLLGLVWWYWRQ